MAIGKKFTLPSNGEVQERLKKVLNETSLIRLYDVIAGRCERAGELTGASVVIMLEQAITSFAGESIAKRMLMECIRDFSSALIGNNPEVLREAMDFHDRVGHPKSS